jgi:hypothetical protein
MASARVVVALIRAFLPPRAIILAENLALHHQLGVLQRSAKRLWPRKRDRIFGVRLSRL